MSNPKIQMNLFHKFIEISASKCPEADRFHEFQYMEQQIRRNFKQVKRISVDSKPSNEFIDYWKELDRESQVAIYSKWVELLAKAVKDFSIVNLPDREAELYVRKSLLSKWQKYKIKLSKQTFYLFAKKLKQFPLQYFSIRRSKNKQHFSWVLQVILHKSKANLKSIHCGTNNFRQFEQWYKDLQLRIDLSRIEYFRQRIELGKEQTHPDQPEQLNHQNQNNPTHNIDNYKSPNKQQDKLQLQLKMKTMTQLLIDSQMKNVQQCQEIVTIQQHIEQHSKYEDRVEQCHPNIFKKLLPGRDLRNFTEIASNATLLQCDKMFRLYELSLQEGEDEDEHIKIKIMILFNYNRSQVFRALAEQHSKWNNDIEVFTFKTKISSQNSALIYQKDKSQGFLYRQRDFLFIRHCFSVAAKQSQKQKIFIVDKSIDSVNHPPFMSVTRGEKQLIWCLAGNSEDKECVLVIQGWIDGGGYMTSVNNKDMTVKALLKVTQLESYLKQKQYLSVSDKGMIFQQSWFVEEEKDEQQFYSAEEFEEEFDKPKQPPPPQETHAQKEQQKQFQQFIKQTSAQHSVQPQQPQPKHTNQQMIEHYVPPQFTSDRTMIIPQTYLKTQHNLRPSQKSKKPLYFPNFRGHHIWKGEWAICPTGGLNYVDQEKMNEQKKVLTFIIKRIGKNILTGKGVLNVSLPVDIFCRESNLEKLAVCFGYCPNFLEKAAGLKSAAEQMKWIVVTGISNSLLYLTMQKPFNPILGQTHQSWIDDCPVYFQQISHHPPIAAYLMFGRGYTVSGNVEAKMDLSINSGTGVNEGIYTIKFDNGSTFNYTTAPGQLSGLTYGQRKLIFINKTFYWNMQEGLFLQVTLNPAKSGKRFFGWSNSNSNNISTEDKMQDYFEGVLKRYRKQQLEQFLTKKGNDNKRSMIITKSAPPFEPIQQLYKVHGRWTKYVLINDQKLFDIDNDRYYRMRDDPNPLPSQSNFRQDVIYRKLNNFVLSQQFKQILQVRQRKDKKLRADYQKTSKKIIR